MGSSPSRRWSPPWASSRTSSSRRRSWWTVCRRTVSSSSTTCVYGIKISNECIIITDYPTTDKTVNMGARFGNKNNNNDNYDDEINHFDSGEECVVVVAGPKAFILDGYKLNLVAFIRERDENDPNHE